MFISTSGYLFKYRCDQQRPTNELRCERHIVQWALQPRCEGMRDEEWTQKVEEWKDGGSIVLCTEDIDTGSESREESEEEETDVKTI